MLQHLFYQALQQNGIPPYHEINPLADGHIHRFTVAGDTRDTQNGWYVLYPLGDGYVGRFGCWKRNVWQKFSTLEGKKFSAEERRQRDAALQKAQVDAQAEQHHRQASAAATATARWQQAKPADPNHPYLAKKQTLPHHARQHSGNLLIPIVNGAGRLRSLQEITPDGRKRFLAGGEVSGCFATLGELGKTVFIAEGFATASSIHQATGCGVVVAFFAHNLTPVGRVIRQHYPHAELIFCADNDAHTPGNPGLSCAKDAARAVQGQVVVPLQAHGDKADFNDVHVTAGLAEVKRQLALAKPVMAPPPALDYGNAEALLRENIPEATWAVPMLLPEGVTMLVAPPKAKKTFLGLNIAVAKATGGNALGAIEVERGRVLFLAMEDTKRRLQKRLAGMVGPAEERPEGLLNLFDYRLNYPRMGEGGLEALDDYLITHPDTELVVIDTFARFRQVVRGRNNSNAFMDDYQQGEELVALARKHEVSFLVIHHSRKAKSDDVLDDVNGTNGLAAAMDNFLVLRKARGEDVATLYPMGKDIIDDNALALVWDPDTISWQLQGDAKAILISPERRAVLEILKTEGPLSGKAIAQRLYPQVDIQRDSPQWTRTRMLLKRMAESGLIFQDRDSKTFFVKAGEPHSHQHQKMGDTSDTGYTDDTGYPSDTDEAAHVTLTEASAVTCGHLPEGNQPGNVENPCHRVTRVTPDQQKTIAPEAECPSGGEASTSSPHHPNTTNPIPDVTDPRCGECRFFSPLSVNVPDGLGQCTGNPAQRGRRLTGMQRIMGCSYYTPAQGDNGIAPPNGGKVERQHDSVRQVPWGG